MGLMDQNFHKKRLEEKLARKETLEPAPDGPRLDYFNALELSQAIESEVTRSKGANGTKLRLDMDHDNAMKLASYLRRAVLAGV